MNNWIPKNKTVRFSVLIAFSGVLLYFVSLFVVFRETKQIEDLYHSSESELFKEEKFRAVQSVVESNKELIQNLENFFIKKGDEVKFIEQIETAAKNSGIEFLIDSIDVASNQNDPFKEDVKIKIKTEGSWRGTMNFIDKLEKMPFGVLIENIDLDGKSSVGWSGSVGFVVFREK